MAMDNTSRRRVEEVIDRAQEAKYQALHARLRPRRANRRKHHEDAWPKTTGGKFYHANEQGQLLEIFENLSIQLHDDGIDEDALRQTIERDRRTVLSGQERRGAKNDT